jgi:serine/threonine-protein kinase
VKILDFGVAKLADGQFASGVRTHSAMVLGTPMYMSPEQCKSSAKVDHRSDIYAVGCILFELLTGRTPYDGDAGELIAKHQLAPVPTPRSVLPEVTPELDRLVTQMLAKTPDERPETMTFVDEALATIEDPKAAAKAAKAPKKPARSAEPHVSKQTSATTLVESAGETTASTPSIPRWKLVAGALAVITLGVVLGVVFTGGKSSSVAEGPTPPVAHDAAVMVPDAPPVQQLVQETTEAPPPDEPCDAAALKAKGDDYLQSGQDAAALVAFEASMICKPDSSMLRLAFMAACRAKNEDTAKQHYAAMPQN